MLYTALETVCAFDVVCVYINAVQATRSHDLCCNNHSGVCIFMCAKPPHQNHYTVYTVYIIPIADLIMELNVCGCVVLEHTLTLLMRNMTGLCPPPTPHTLSRRAMLCLIFSNSLARFNAALHSVCVCVCVCW